MPLGSQAYASNGGTLQGAIAGFRVLIATCSLSVIGFSVTGNSTIMATINGTNTILLEAAFNSTGVGFNTSLEFPAGELCDPNTIVNNSITTGSNLSNLGSITYDIVPL
jgi:hypothetical protein